MRWCGLMVCLLSCPVLALDAARVSSIVREADYTIGSVARQQVVVDTPHGYRLDAGSLPEKGLTDAIELRDVQWDARDTGASTRHYITLDWQIFVAGDTTRIVPLKALQLQFVRDGKLLPVSVRPGNVFVSSLLPVKMDKRSVQPYPDVKPPLMPTQQLWLLLFGGGFGVMLAGMYFAHYFGWLFGKKAPMYFRAATRDIRRLRSRPEAVRSAMQRLAAAYSAYAGYAVTPGRLDTLLATRPEMAPLEADTRTFFADLQRVFFAGTSPEYDVQALERLARRLCQMEAL